MTEREEAIETWQAAAILRDELWQEWKKARETALKRKDRMGWSAAWEALRQHGLAVRRVEETFAMIPDPPHGPLVDARRIMEAAAGKPAPPEPAPEEPEEETMPF